MKVALVYDRINTWGGAERVLLALHAIFPDAPLYTSVYNPETAPWAKKFIVVSSFLRRLRGMYSAHQIMPYLMPMAFEGFTFEQYDVVISVTSEAAKGIITQPGTKHLCLCLTPTRYLWSGYDEYFKNRLFRWITSPIVQYLRVWDQMAVNRPDRIVAISEEVRRRIKRYYHKDVSVIYPPVTLGRGKRKPKEWHNEPFDSGYYLIISRLVQYKKVRLAIEACNQLKLPLKIIGSGSEEETLKSIAGPTIEFFGNLTEDAIISYYTGCNALLFPGLEDFGLTIVEAQKFGRPVIAFKGGGALETIVSGRTGYFFYPQTKSALVKTLKEFKEANRGLTRKKFVHKYETQCRKNVEKFSYEVFKKEILALIREIRH